MKYLPAIATCFLFACLSPVSEVRDAGSCRESLGLAQTNKGLLPEVAGAPPGELRGGRYFFGWFALVDARTLKPVVETLPIEVGVSPCSNVYGGNWWQQPNATYLRFGLQSPSGSWRSVLYEYSEGLQAELDDACRADAGLGPALWQIERDEMSRQLAVATIDAGFLVCGALVDDAGVPREMLVYRPEDGGIVSRVPSSAAHCGALRPPLALTYSDGGAELINFETRSQVATLSAGALCEFTREGVLLCRLPNSLALRSPQSSTELAREEGATFTPKKLTVRERQFAQRVSADGGYAWYWFRNGAAELLDEGMPPSTIGDFDDRNIFYVIDRELPDAGHMLEFERRCLPN